MLVSWLMMFLLKGNVGREMSETSRVFFSVININSKSLGRTGSADSSNFGKASPIQLANDSCHQVKGFLAEVCGICSLNQWRENDP